MKRIFAFGCSYTRYLWPTWADILAHDLEPDLYFNYAGPGLGNYAIYSRMIEADLRHKFTPDDIILVNWTGWAREDKFLAPQGFERGFGSVLHGHFYDEKYIRKYWSVENDIITTANAIISANRMFNINYQSTLYDWGIPERTIEGINNVPRQHAMFEFYSNHLPKNLDIWLENIDADYLTPADSFGGIFNSTGVSATESHADVIAHLGWYKYRVATKLGLGVKDSTEKYFTKLHNRIVHFTTTNCVDYQNNIHQMFREMIEDKAIISWNQGFDPDRLKF
jgi:hypothetical protein